MASAAYSSPMAGPYAEIKVAAVGLHPRRPARRLNSFAVLLKSHGARDAQDARWEELARTETVSGDASPAFVESFEVPCSDGKSDRSELVVALFQKTARSDELRKNTLLGYARFSVAKILRGESGTLQLPLEGTSILFKTATARSAPPSLFDYSPYHRSTSSSTSSVLSSSSRHASPLAPAHGGRRGVIILCGERVIPNRPAHMYRIQLGLGAQSRAWGPLDTDAAANSVFFVLYRAIPGSDAVYTPVYRSEVLDIFADRKTPRSFRTATIRAERLHGVNEHRPLRVEFFHNSRAGGPHAPIGYVQMSASSFKYARPGGKLFVVPNRAAGLASASVVFDSAVMAEETRRATLASGFSMHATGFVWGSALNAHGHVVDDYLERDENGRAVRTVEGVGSKTLKPIPRGVSYMSLLASRIGSSINSEDTDSSRSPTK